MPHFFVVLGNIGCQKIALAPKKTSNTYSCIELNAHGMFLVIEKLRLKDIFEVFTPWLFSSQLCEKKFRETRAMSSIFSTMVNYSLLEILRRLRRIQALNEISTDLGKILLYSCQYLMYL